MLTSLISKVLNGSRQVTQEGVKDTSAKIDAHIQCGHIGGPLVYKIHLKKHERAAAKKLRKLTRKLTSLRPPKCTYLDQIATVFGTAEHIPPLRPTDDLPFRTSSARTSCLAEIC